MSETDTKKRYVIDNTPGGYAVRVACLECGQMLRLCDAVIDSQGPSFKAYYHQKHAPEGWEKDYEVLRG